MQSKAEIIKSKLKPILEHIVDSGESHILIKRDAPKKRLPKDSKMSILIKAINNVFLNELPPKYLNKALHSEIEVNYRLEWSSTQGDTHYYKKVIIYTIPVDLGIGKEDALKIAELSDRLWGETDAELIINKDCKSVDGFLVPKLLYNVITRIGGSRLADLLEDINNYKQSYKGFIRLFGDIREDKKAYSKIVRAIKNFNKMVLSPLWNSDELKAADWMDFACCGEPMWLTIQKKNKCILRPDNSILFIIGNKDYEESLQFSYNSNLEVWASYNINKKVLQLQTWASDIKDRSRPYENTADVGGVMNNILLKYIL